MRYTLFAIDRDIGKAISAHRELSYGSFWNAAVREDKGPPLFFSGESEAYEAVMLGFDRLSPSEYRPSPQAIYMVSEADLATLDLVLELMDLSVDKAFEDPSYSAFFVKLPIPEKAVYKR